MARLADLVTGYADVLKAPPGTVRNVAAILRAEKLLTSGPRGPGAPHMTPTDASNLLLALMYDDAQENAPINVPRLRAAELTSCVGRLGFDHGGGKVDHIPPHDFIGMDGHAFRLGEMLDAMLDRLVRFGTLDDEPEEGAAAGDWPYVKNIAFSISRPGYASRLWIDTVSVHWTLAYSWNDPLDEALRAAEAARGELPQHSLARLGTFMHRTRSIEDAELSALAEVLRGQKIDPDRPAAQLTPPYEIPGAPS